MTSLTHDHTPRSPTQWTGKPGEHRKWQRDLATHSQIILKHNFPYREKEAERAKLAALSEAA